MKDKKFFSEFLEDQPVISEEAGYFQIPQDDQGSEHLERKPQQIGEAERPDPRFIDTPGSVYGTMLRIYGKFLDTSHPAAQEYVKERTRDWFNKQRGARFIIPDESK